MNGKKSFISLKTKIMISTLVPLIVSFIFICLVIFSLLRSSLRDAAESKFLQVSQKYAHSFDTKINSAIDYLTIISSELEIQVATGSTDREMLQKTVMKVFEDYNMLDGSSVYFEADMYDGKDADYVGSEYGTAQSGRICWYFFIDETKTAYLPEAMENDTEFKLPHYTEAKKLNKPIYTNPVAYEIDGKHIPMFTLTYPIHDISGAFIGAVTVDLFLEDMYAQLQNEKIYETGYVIVANDNGKIIYCPHYEDIGKSREEAGLNYPLPSKGETSVFFNAKSTINGKDTLATIESVYISQLDSTFYISVSAPISEINAEGIRLILSLYAFSLAIIAAIAVLLYYLIGKISTPIKEITAGINKIADGDYDARITGTYKGELAVVKDSVNTMADSIKSYIEESQDSLNILKNILNGLNAVIYVSDPDTDEILFINDNMRELFELEDDGIGQICWKIFQSGFEARCEFCPCYQLNKEPDKVVIWEEHNTVTKRYYHNTDRYISWVGGRKAHLQHSIDITDIKTAQLTLDKRLEQQALMISISQSFLSYTDIDLVIAHALRMIGEFMGVAQILFYELDSTDGITLICRNEWINPSLGLETRIGSKLELKGDMLHFMNKLSNTQDFCLTSDNQQTKEEMMTYRMNFRSYITTPVYIKENVCAVLDFSKEDDGAQWSESDINLATLVSSMLSGVFDRYFMEDQLRNLSSIVESSPQFIAYITPGGEMNYVNPAAMAITGYSEDELIKGGLDMIFDMQTVRDIKEIYIPKTLSDGTCNFELNLFCKDGLKRIMTFSSFTTGIDSANVGCIASDVTEMRKLESELIVAKELAEQGSRSKSEFLSRMSHEMRTPMNAIIGMTNIAKNSNDISKKEYCLEKIENASSHLLGVINDILDMSKIEANKFELTFSEFSFESMVLNVLNVINFRADEKHQELSFHIDPSIPAVLINDEQRLAQVITNLLSNAVKFTPERGLIQLRAFVLGEEDEIVTLQIEVIDSGIGISNEQQTKLFRSFEQADGSIARRFGGTGLGLAISKRIVEMMGGEIRVESDLEKGSKFIFTIKAKKGQHLPMNSLKTHIEVGELNVIVVDDSQEVLDYFKYVMDDIGIPCVVASDGAKALELFKNSPKPFDIAFIDWRMPEMNGIELTVELRKLRGIQPIIIMISAAEWNDIENEASEAGVNGFVPKPLFPSLLIDCIIRHLGNMTDEESMDTVTGDSPHSYEGKTALLVEDVEINREIILTILEDTKLKIECAENGRQAVDMFVASPEKYDIIFMDIHMPEVDGFEATRLIRGLDVPQGASVPIIAMTANVFNEDIKKCLDTGMNDHVGKPIDFDELFNKLEKYLNNSH